jgi:AAA15 family ATPase/GTPase
MIIEFTVGNFLSFKEKRTISFEARGVSELKENVITSNSYKLLRSLVIYGANSSGKSNVIEAFNRMKNCILESVRLNDTDKLDYSPFLLSSESINQPTFFEIIFFYGTQRFRYGFEYNFTEVVNEWLFTGKGRNSEEKSLFIRTPDGIGVSEYFKEGKDKEAATNKNRLFLSLVAQLNGKISKQVIECFMNYNVLSGILHQGYGGFSLEMFDKQLDGCDKALDLFKNIHLGFQKIEVMESAITLNDLPKDMPSEMKSKIVGNINAKKRTLNTVHNTYNKKGKIVDTKSWYYKEYESEGTKKIIDLSGPIFDTLLNGRVLIVDELDTKLHPLITVHIIRLFNNRETNPNNAQLLFATHDTNLLRTSLFRRDQIWFTEKDSIEQTDLYSLDDFVFPDGTKVRKDANLERNYIAGRYGAIPYITQ